MLCALADYFQVTTDALLGRNAPPQYAVIATVLPELGSSIQTLVESHGFLVKKISSSIQEAREVIAGDPSINHLFASFSKPLTEEEQGESPKGVRYVEVHSDNGDVLAGFELYFHNISAIESLGQKNGK